MTMRKINYSLMVLLILPLQLLAQQLKVSGKVTNIMDGKPLVGVNVRTSGDIGSSGVLTNSEGNYQITVSGEKAILVFTHIGMQKVERQVSDNRVINISMSADETSLNTVVVTALGIKREARSLSYSTQGLSGDDLDETKSPNLINSLSGKIAGVQVVPPGFNTGSARIIIRGNSSLTGNNQPLFVVDGMPIDNTPGDGNIDYGNGAANLNYEDIASVEVLKGPNASALYGSRGANGVILITSKKGSGTSKVSINSSLMFQKLTEFPEYQNAYGVGTSFYIDNTHTIPMANVNYRSWGAPMLGQPYIAINGELKPYLPNPDNVKDFYSTARLFTNNVALEGGNANSIYRISYTNYSGTSVVDGFNKQAKNSFDLSLQNKPYKMISVDSKISFVRDRVNNRQYSNSNGRNPTNLYTHMARSTDLSELMPYKDELTGKEIGTHRNFSNPYWVINENPNEDTKDRLIVAINPQVNINSWLRFNARLGGDVYWWDGYEFNNIGSIIANNPDGFMRTFNTKQQNFNGEGLLTAKSNYKDFSLMANIGASMFSSNFERREQMVNSLLQPGLINLSNAKEYPTVSQNIRKRRLNSIYSALSFGYRNYAFIDVTGRNDWTSTLPKNNNSYFYPSIGGSLIVNELLGLKSDLLSFAKLRASYAVVGNDTDPYRLNQTYSFTGLFNGATLAALSNTMNNPDLKPERTVSKEFGTTFKLFRNRITLDGTYYDAATTNQIVTAQLPTSSGYQQRIYNAGKIRNWGYEFSGNGKIVEGSNFSWSTQLNYSKNNSKVISLIDGIDRFQLNNNSSYLYVYAEVGKPYAYLRGLGVARNADGNMLIEDGGSLLVKDPDMGFGTASPDWLAGLSNTFRYKKFDVSFLIDVKKGGVIYSGSTSRMLTNGVSAETLNGRDDYYKHTIIFGENGTELSGGAMWDAYFANGTKNTKYVTPQNYEYARPNYAEFVIYDASYVKLREVVVGYNLPTQLLKKLMVKSARISASGRNLAILYKKTPKGIDPEASSTSGNGQGIENGALPPNAIYGFNLRLTF